MRPTIRVSLNWLHTWAGLVFGGLLFAIFWTGTLSVFDREIDRWMAPASRLSPIDRPPSLDALREFYETAVREKAITWSVTLPSERQPMLVVAWRNRDGSTERHLDPATGALLPDPGTLAGTGFLYPFHYTLHVQAARLGQWLVGAAGLAMLVLCVSGLVIHRRIFADFFLFRPARNSRRWLLDLHTLVGIAALPFILVITFSGIAIAWPVYFQGSLWSAFDGGRAAFNREAFDLFDRPSTGRPATLASLDRMVAIASELWSGEPLRSLTVRHPGDTGAYVQIVRREESAIGGTSDRIYFDAASEALLHRTTGLKAMVRIDRFIAGLHEVQFRHWTLRWLYFGLGLLGCVLIATGSLFWLESRRRRHVQLALQGVRLMEGLTIGSVTGLVIATLAFFVVNRLMPTDATFLGEKRAALEVWTFCSFWIAAFAHAWLRPGRAWREQCAVIACLAGTAVGLNWITTGHHLARGLGQRHLWPVAGMDLLLLATAAIAAMSAIRLWRASRLQQVRKH